LTLPAAVGSLRLADAVGASIDRSLVDGAYYARVGNLLRADFALDMGPSQLDAGYGLRIYPNYYTSEIEPFHTANLRYTYTAPRLSLSLSETGGIGKQSFLGAGRASPLVGLSPVGDTNAPPTATPSLATPAAIDSSTVPGAQSLDFVSLRTAANGTYRLGHELTWNLIVGYQLSGGLTREARRYVTLQHVLDGSLSLGYAPSSRTSFVSALLVAHGWNSRNDDYGLLTLSESWQYKWTPATSTDLGLGLSSRIAQGANDATVIVTTPVGSAGITHVLRARDTTGTLRLSVTYTPLVDVATGRIQNRLNATASAGVSHGDVAAGINGTLWKVIPSSDPGASSGMGGGVYASYQIISWLGASLSAQVTKQAYVTTGLGNATPLPSGVAWGVYGGLYAVSPTWRF
jgi:hypothetical protein